jgi:disulfide bond formation protein DsbB
VHGPARPSRASPPDPAALVLLVSGMLLIGALAFQHLGGLAPCPMCHWQRWGHVAAAALAATALLARSRALALAAIAALALAGALGLWHAGVEQGWWPSPVGCAASVSAAGTAEAFVDRLMQAPLVRCDQIPWSFLGLSMAGWNAAVSFAGALLAGLMWRR